MTDTDITTVPIIPSELTEGEGRELLTHFQEMAAAEIRQSAKSLTMGIMHLNTIRKHSLFTYGGYNADQWDVYLSDFQSQQGFGRATIYGNLKVIRLMMGGLGLDKDTVLLFGVPRLRPITTVITGYDRKTGEIKGLANGVADKLSDLPGETDGERLGSWVKANLDPETDTVATIHALLDDELPHKIKYSWFPVRDGQGNLTDIAWEAIPPDGKEEAGYTMTEMPQHVQSAFLKKLGYREG